MNAIVYALPAPFVNNPATAEVIALPRRTKYGLQETLPFEWPAKPQPQYVSPRVTALKATDFDVQPTGRKDLPPAKEWSVHLAKALIEVVNGSRSVSQLLRWVTPEVMSGIKFQLARKGFPKFQLSSINVHETDDGVAEISAVFKSNERAYAMAMRLEGLDGKWRATSLIWGF